jgi:FKBP-type peptidyl-prolyl cis-trans isomerase SlpA
MSSTPLAGSSAAIRVGSHVTLHFRLSLADGTVVFDTFAERPATIQIGEGHIAAPLERFLTALNEGDERCYELAPDDGFGPRNPDLLQRVSRALLSRHSDAALGELTPGDIIEFPTPDGLGGRVAGVFKGWEGDAAMFDFNHPLAGQALRFDVRIIGVL